MEFETLRNVETPAGRRRRLDARQYFLHDFGVGDARGLFNDDLVDLTLGVDMKARRHIASAGLVLRRRVTRDLRSRPRVPLCEKATALSAAGAGVATACAGGC